MNPKVLVTGATGFLGLHLMDALKSNNIEAIPFYGDLVDYQNVHSQISDLKVDMIYHLAALSNIHDCEQNPQKAFNINVTGTFNLLESLRRTKSKVKFVFPSTSHVYATSNSDSKELCIDENYPVSPSTVYGITKLQAEGLIRLYFDSFQIGSGIILRLFNHTHISQSGPFFFPQLYSQIKNLSNKQGKIKVGNLNLNRDFSFVDDLMKLMMVLEQKEVSFTSDVFNVSSNQPRNLMTLARELAKRLNAGVVFEPDPEKMRGDEPLTIIGQSSKIQALFNWHPTIHTDESFIERFLSQGK